MCAMKRLKVLTLILCGYCRKCYGWLGFDCNFGLKLFAGVQSYVRKLSVHRVSLVVPDKRQRSHISSITWHTICHCFLIAHNRYHGSEKEVSTAAGTVLVKTVTVGRNFPIRAGCWMLNLIHWCACPHFNFRQGMQLSPLSVWWLSQRLSTYNRVWAKKGSLSEAKPKGRL